MNSKNINSYSDNIYVSLHSAQKKDLAESLDYLLNLGFKNIELCGGTDYNENYKNILIEFKEKYNLKYLVHNYYPAPKENFSLNLSSINHEIINNSIDLMKKAIDLCTILDCKRYSYHAGFRLSPQPSELGVGLKKNKLIERNYACEIFKRNSEAIIKYGKERGVIVYIENNVLGKKNHLAFNENPFIFTDATDINLIEKHIKANVLLDVAHLKVSCNNLGLNFQDQLKILSKNCNYYHLSNNSGCEDENKQLNLDDDILTAIKNIKLKKDTYFTIEVYSGEDSLRKSYHNLYQVLNEK